MMGFVAKYNWNSHDCTNAQVYVAGYVDNTTTSVRTYIFDEFVYAKNNEFYYSIPDLYFYDNTEGSGYSPLVLDFSTGSWALYGDTGTPSIDLTVMEVYAQTEQFKHFTTEHKAVVTDRTSIFYTDHSVFIDRTEHYSSSGSIIFWDSSDVSEVSDATTIENFYDKEPALTYGVLPKQAAGKLHIKRTTNTTQGGINGTVKIDATALSGYKGINLSVYIDRTASAVGPVYLGSMDFNLARVTYLSKEFTIPEEIMAPLSDNSFNDAELYIINTGTPTSTWGLMDSYLTFAATTETNIDTSHDATVAAAGVPIVWNVINTNHRARINGGRTYVIDYYTPGYWWNISNTGSYTVENWNTYEEISQHFARFFHSPLYFNSQLPDFGYIELLARSNGNVKVSVDYPSANRRTNIVDYTYQGTRGFSVLPEIGNLLNIYYPVVSPDVVECDSTFFKVDTFVEDNTIGIVFREKDGGLYTYWSGENKHPFKVDQTFHLSFYGKKG